MADELDVLLERVTDPALRAELRSAVDKVRAKRSFGLVFEAHLPERVRLPDHPVRRGTKVTRKGDKRAEPMAVLTVRRRQATVASDDGTLETLPVGELVVVAEFGEPVYPGLASVGSIIRGGDKPAHVVINAENHHALEMLQFTHSGKVDCVYIDPPYNTGARDWKYDNDYVDGEDAYRHSKWLAFMERRLLLAKQLLNPENSVLIVTIDEKEYLRLGMLLQQTFPSSTIQMVTSVINRKGSARSGGFSRVDEYLYYVTFGDAAVRPTSVDVIGLGSGITKERLPDIWNQLMRRGSGSARADRPNLFYPIYVDPERRAIVAIGEALPPDQDRAHAPAIDGLDTVLPMRSNGADGRWSVGPDELRERLAQGFAKVGTKNADTGVWTINYLIKADMKRLASGEVVSKGRDATGAHILEYADMGARLRTPKTVWNIGSHDATEHGRTLLASFVPGRPFPFPKSLYAVEDALRFVLRDNPDAVVLDFFAGSGTTAHAVMRLNRQDGGRRQAIVITNNEVSAEEAKSLAERGYSDGDPEWEALGIFEHITRPRITAAVTGLTPEGAPIKGDYRFTDEFPMSEGFEENVEFMKLTYLDPVDAELDRAFSAIAPMLWLRAGGHGSMISERNVPGAGPVHFAIAERYGVLFDPDHWRDFVAALPETARTVFVVTDSSAVFAGVAESLPADLEVVRLYENYLTTFAINRGSTS